MQGGGRELGGGDVARVHPDETTTPKIDSTEGQAGTFSLRAGADVPFGASVGVVACVWNTGFGAQDCAATMRANQSRSRLLFMEIETTNPFTVKLTSETLAAKDGWEVM